MPQLRGNFFVLVSLFCTFQVIAEMAKSSTITGFVARDSDGVDKVQPHDTTNTVKETAESTHSNDEKMSLGSQSCSDQYYDKGCSECHVNRRDPTPSELTMYLHALSYKVRNGILIALSNCAKILNLNLRNTAA